MEKYEESILQAYLNFSQVPSMRRFEFERYCMEDLVERFLSGERFENAILPFSDDEKQTIRETLSQKSEKETADLKVFALLTEAVCVIINKYRK